MRAVLWMHELSKTCTGDIRTGALPAATSAPSQTWAWKNRNTEIQTETKHFVHPCVTARGEVGFGRGHTTGNLPRRTPEQVLAFPWVVLYFWSFTQT